jgi:hypothetical protein
MFTLRSVLLEERVNIQTATSLRVIQSAIERSVKLLALLWSKVVVEHHYLDLRTFR